MLSGIGGPGIRGPRVGGDRVFAVDAMRGKSGGDEICNFGRAGVEDHRFNRRERGKTLLNTAVPLLPRIPLDGRTLSEDSSPIGVVYEGNVGRAGTELKASLSISNEGERGRSRLGYDRVDKL